MNQEDAESVAHLIAKAFDEVIIKYHSPLIVEKFKGQNTPEHLVQQMQWKEVYVVEEDGEIIATGALANFGNKDFPKFSLSNFYVKPELHRHGVGRELFAELYRRAIELGVEELHVPSTRNGVRFYERMGFSVDTAQDDLEDEITWMSMKLDVNHGEESIKGVQYED
jgi:N-acetylglutamate synthase-like GNAT family acetyltransferase